MNSKDRRRRVATLVRRHGSRCYWCQVPLDTEAKYPTPSPPRATIDHKVPVSLGGEHKLANLVLACEPCNARRGGVHSADSWPDLRGLPSAKGQRSKANTNDATKRERSAGEPSA